MNRLTNLSTGLKSLFSKPRVDRELEEELDTYLAVLHQPKSVQLRHVPQSSKPRPRNRELGSRNTIKHHVWTSRWESTLDSILQDIHFSLRSLRKTPGFTLVALLSLALGIGANTAIFTLIHQVLLRNLPSPHPEQLVTLGNSKTALHRRRHRPRPTAFFPWYFARQLQADPGPFQGVAALTAASPTKSPSAPECQSQCPRDSRPTASSPATTSASSAPTAASAAPSFPRTTPLPAAGAVVVLSHHFWQQSLSSDPAHPRQDPRHQRRALHRHRRHAAGTSTASSRTSSRADLWTPVSMQTVVLQHPSLLTPDRAVLPASSSHASVPSRQPTKPLWPRARTGSISRFATASAQCEAPPSPRPPAGNQSPHSPAAPCRLTASPHPQSVRRLSQNPHGRRRPGPPHRLRQSRQLPACCAPRPPARNSLLVWRSAPAAVASFARASSKPCCSPSPAALLGLASPLPPPARSSPSSASGAAHTAIDPLPTHRPSLHLGVSLSPACSSASRRPSTPPRTGAAVTLSSNARTAQSGGGRSSRFWPRPRHRTGDALAAPARRRRTLLR